MIAAYYLYGITAVSLFSPFSGIIIYCLCYDGDDVLLSRPAILCHSLLLLHLPSHAQAVGVILAVIASKMIFETFGVTIISPLQSLLLVIVILSGGVGLSLWEVSRNPGEEE